MQIIVLPVLQPLPNNNEQGYQKLWLSQSLQASTLRSKSKENVSRRDLLNCARFFFQMEKFKITLLINKFWGLRSLCKTFLL